MTQIIPTAEPFFFPGNRTGCLLVHGFTGAPKEMRWVGEYLASKGFSVLGVRLAGHATKPEDMIRSNWTDWTASVEDGFHLLRGVADHIYLVGLSMGAVLSLLMSTRLDVKGVVVMSTPYKLVDDWRLNYIDLLSKFIPYLPKGNYPPGAGWFDQESWKDHVSYPQNPVRSLGQLNRLLAEMRAALPKVNVPVLLIHSKDDGYVLPENLENIYASLGASDKTKIYITGSGHVVTRDAARNQVFEAAYEFIRRVESASE
ncbi:MAG: alpha/beta fold hydrolase [Chloroflexi bacterium]|nr:alpha/beta fold hydrolase [Chloroflexota bacterium]MCL5612140.1 alpha/beta fold hydrolase [Chloroflexota bacterium]